MITALRHYTALTRRSIRGILRRPTTIVPPMMFPLLFMAIATSAYGRAIELRGFPTVDSFLQFVIATTIVQGALFGSISPGSDLAGDIEGGFFDRLIVSPVTRTTIILSRVSAAGIMTFFQAWLFFGVASLFGLVVEGGFLGMLAVTVVAAVFSAGIAGLFAAFGLRTGSAEAVQGSFPAVFAAFFISSAFFPRDLMDGWFQAVASANPLSHMIEALRVQVITGLNLHEFLVALMIAGCIFVGGILISLYALRRRLAAGA